MINLPESAGLSNTGSLLFYVLEQKALHLDLRQGAIIFHPAQKQECLYFVKTGVLRSYTCRDGMEVTRWFYTDGDLACASPVCFHGLPSEIGLEAACRSVILQVYKEDYYTLCTKNPDLENLINAMQADFWNRYSHYSDELKRLSRAERYQKFSTDFPQINLRAKVRDIASFLGMTPETLSKVRNKARG